MKNNTNVFVSMTRFIIGSSLVVMAFVVAPFVAGAETLTRQLEQGMSGADVSSLQTYLAKDATIYPQGLVTGYFGTLTTSAVSNFQARNGIATAGRVGPITLVALNAVMGSDNMAPYISALNLSTSNNSVTMSWNTSENASAIIYYSTSPLQMIESSATNGVTVGGSSMLVHTDLRSSHSATLTSLNANTVYYYVVYARDVFGNETITWPATFITAQ
jgi:peptidoglycan hydrolase-like protein with peptidoglycan-binding domain